jgi:hypothetical protein
MSATQSRDRRINMAESKAKKIAKQGATSGRKSSGNQRRAGRNPMTVELSTRRMREKTEVKRGRNPSTSEFVPDKTGRVVKPLPAKPRLGEARIRDAVKAVVKK